MIRSEIVKAEHLSAIAEIERECFSEPWSEEALGLFVREGAFGVIVSYNGEIGSYCTVLQALDEAQIINVATRSELRGRGLARATVERVIEECKKRNIVSVSLEVRRSNVAAISLYEALGFCVCGERRGFYKDPREDALIMIKEI